MPTITITEERLVAAPPETVGKAIASPHGLGTWFCDEAQVEKKPDGRLIFGWNDGRLAIGRWTAFDQSRHLAWRVADEPGANPTEVAFHLAPEGAGTRLTVAETGVAAEAGEKRQRFWRNAMDDIRVFAETGRNNRLLRRPMLGVNIDLVTPEKAKKDGLPFEGGILITGTTPDGGAHNAGLQQGDILVRLEGHDLRDWGSIGSVLDGRNAGEVVTARFYRGAEAREVAITLHGRPAPESPEGRAAIGEALRKATNDWIAALESLLAGVTEEQASARPAEGEWNIKEVLGHLSFGERFGQDYLMRLATDSRPPTWAEDFGSFWQDAVAAFTLDQLMGRFIDDLRAGEALSLAVLAKEPAPWVERSIAEGIYSSGEHLNEHLEQIKRCLGRT
jgi:uncharacterized protein YndB with AHSA1/START domain